MGNEWPQFRIEDIAFVTDFTANGSFAGLRENVPYFRSPEYAILVRLVDFNSNWENDRVYVSKKSYDFLKKSFLTPNDVIVSNIGEYAGTVFKAPDLNQPMTLGPNALVVKPNNNSIITKNFLYYYLKSPDGRNKISSIITGSAQPKFTKTDFRGLIIPLPPLPVQQKIVSILGALDEKIELNNRMNKTLEEIARTLFRHWFVDDPSPEWVEKPLSDLINIQKGKKPKDSSEINQNYLPQILIETLDTGKSDFVDPEGMVISRQSDSIMVMDGASSGRVEIGFCGVIGSTLARISPKGNLLGNYVLYNFLKNIEGETRNHLTGTSIPHADKKWLLLQNMKLPAEQQMASFERYFSIFQEKIINNRKENFSLSTIRDLLIPKLLSGKP